MEVRIYFNKQFSKNDQMENGRLLSDYQIPIGSKYDAPEINLYYHLVGPDVTEDNHNISIKQNQSNKNTNYLLKKNIQSNVIKDPILWSKLATDNAKFNHNQ